MSVPSVPPARQPSNVPPPLPAKSRNSSRILIAVIGVILLLLLLLLLLLMNRQQGGIGSGADSGQKGSGGESQGTSGPANEEQRTGQGKPAQADLADSGSSTSPAQSDGKTNSPPTDAPSPETETGDQGPDDEPPPLPHHLGDPAENRPQKPLPPRTVPIGNISGGAEFFGVTESAGAVSFVIDYSGSMEGERFLTAREQFLTSVRKLPGKQLFNAFFFDDNFRTLHSGRLVEATADVKKEFQNWALQLNGGGGTNPAPAIEAAVQSGTKCIFLLSDGEFEVELQQRVVTLCKEAGVVVHTYSMHVDSVTLKTIAEECGGVYTLVK
jgi:hypothetical protein